MSSVSVKGRRDFLLRPFTKLIGKANDYKQNAQSVIEVLAKHFKVDEKLSFLEKRRLVNKILILSPVITTLACKSAPHVYDTESQDLSPQEKALYSYLNIHNENKNSAIDIKPICDALIHFHQKLLADYYAWFHL